MAKIIIDKYCDKVDRFCILHGQKWPIFSNKPQITPFQIGNGQKWLEL